MKIKHTWAQTMCHVIWALPAMPCHTSCWPALVVVGNCCPDVALLDGRGLRLRVNKIFDHMTEIKKYENHLILS